MASVSQHFWNVQSYACLDRVVLCHLIVMSMFVILLIWMITYANYVVVVVYLFNYLYSFVVGIGHGF